MWPDGTLPLALGLLAIVVILQWRVIFDGRSLVQTNSWNPFDARPLEANYGPAFVPHEEWARRNLWLYANQRDPGATWWQWEPAMRLLHDAIERREWPWWNPYIAAGTPAMANLVPAFFFPPYLLMVAIGVTPGLQTLYFLGLLYAAGLFTALTARQHGLALGPSLLAGAGVLTSGALNQTLGSFLAQTIACLPVVLYATRLLLDRPSARRIASTAIVYAATALSSFPPLLAALFAVAVVYALGCIALGDCRNGARGRVAAAWAGGAGLAVALVAAAYVPALTLGRDAPQVRELYASAGGGALPVSAIFQLLSSTVAGGVQVYVTGPFSNSLQNGYMPYVGITVVTTALLAAASGSRRRASLLVAAGTASIVLLLKVFGIPPVHSIASLPYLRELHYSQYFALPLGILLPLLAGLGTDAVLRGGVSVWRAGAVGALACVAIESTWRRGAAMPGFSSAASTGWIFDWKALAVVTVFAVGVLVVAAIVRPTRRGWLVTAGLVICVIAEGLVNTRHPLPKRWDVFARPVPYVAAIQSRVGDGRVFPYHLLTPDINEVFGIYSLGSMMAYNPPRVWKLFQHHARPAREIFLRFPRQLPPGPVLDRAAVSIIASPTGALRTDDMAVRGYEKAFDDGFATVFARRSPGRARFTTNVTPATTSAALDLIASLPSHTTILEETPSFRVMPDRFDDPVPHAESSLNTVRVTIDAPRAGLLYLADSYMTGWSATVNGQPARILPANYAFRGVEVPAGRITVEFRYWPPGLTAGLVVTTLGLTTLAALLMIPGGARRTAAPDEGVGSPRLARDEPSLLPEEPPRERDGQVEADETR